MASIKDSISRLYNIDYVGSNYLQVLMEGTSTDIARPVFDKYIEIYSGDTMEIPLVMQHIYDPNRVAENIGEDTYGIFPLLKTNREMAGTNTVSESSVARGVARLLGSNYARWGILNCKVVSGGCTLCQFKGCKGMLFDENDHLIFYATTVHVRNNNREFAVSYKKVYIDNSVFVIDTPLNKTIRKAVMSNLIEDYLPVSDTHNQIVISSLANVVRRVEYNPDIINYALRTLNPEVIGSLI